MYTAPNGDMVYLDVLGQPILMLCSLNSIGDLLEKRGSNYADRSVPPAMRMCAGRGLAVLQS